MSNCINDSNTDFDHDAADGVRNDNYVHDQCIDRGDEAISLETSLDVLAKELTRERQEKKLLQKIASSMWSLDELLDEVLDYLREKWGFSAFIVQIIDEQKNQLICHRYTGLDIDDLALEENLTRSLDLSRPELSISTKVAIRQKLFYARKKDLRAHEDLLEFDAETLSYLDIRENLLIPVVDHGITIGVLQLFSIHHGLNLSIKDIREIKRFISSLSGTIRLLKNNIESERVKTEQQQIINLVNRLGSTIDLRQILEIFGRTVTSENDFDGYLILLKSESEDSLVCESLSLPSEFASIEETYASFRVDLNDESPYSKVFKSNQSETYFKSEQSGYSKYAHHILELWELQSFTILPIANETKSFGVMVFLSQSRNLSHIDSANIDQLSPFLASKIEFSYYYDLMKSKETEVNKSFEFNSSLLQFISEINAVSSVEHVYHAFSEEILKRYNFDTASVFLIQDNALDYTYIYRRPNDNKPYLDDLESYFEADTHFPMNKDGGALVLAIRNDTPIYIPDAQAILDLPMAKIDRDTIVKFPQMRTLLQIPIKKHGEAIGILSLMSFEHKAVLTDDEQQIIFRLCSFMDSVIVNANLYTQIGKQKDELENTLEELKHTQEQLVETERSRLDAMQRAVESAQAATEAKSGFLANMSHEIRTPLNAITGLTELLLQTEQNDKQLDYTKKIFSSSKSLLGLVNDILDFSKIEAGKLDIEKTFFNLNSVVKHIKDMFATKVHENNNELAINIHNDVPVHLIGDPLRLSQVLINLTNNALKFTHNGTVDIEISVVKQSYDEAKIKFAVHDTGSGICDTKVDKLFDSFTQADSSTTRKFGGTGLGLAICKSIIELMGGRIWVESELGEGSTFAFTVIFATSSEGIEAKLKNNAKGKKVLIADDNEAVRVYLTYELQKVGMNVIAAESAESLLDEYRNVNKYFSYDLIITDWKMPDMDGIQLVDTIREEYADKTTPIVMISAYQSEEVKAQAFQKGVNYWLYKPIKDKDLHTIISDIFVDIGDKEEQIFNTNLSQAYEKIFGARLLLVEDNYINQQVAQEMLQGVGLSVDLADDGIMALEVLEKNPKYYDVVLTDIQMPEMDGYTFCEQLRKDARFSEIPVIAMTADAVVGVKEQCLKSGMNDYVTKPVNYSELVQTLSKWVTPQYTESVNTDKNNRRENHLNPNSGAHEINYELELPGINLKNAIERMAGNKKLAISVITSFAKDFYNAPEIIQSSLKNNDKEEAARIAHTVKGLVKTFSTQKIIDDTVALEEAIRKDKQDLISVLLSQFRSSLQPIFESANLLIELNEMELAKDGAAESNNGSAISHDEIKKKSLIFIDYLRTNDFLAMDYLEEIKTLFDQNMFGADIDNINELLGKFDFNSALEVFGKIADHYGVDCRKRAED